MKNIDEAVTRQLAQAEAKRARGTPGAALAGLEMSAKAFKGTVRWKELDDAIRALKADASFKQELKAEKDLEKALAKLAKSPVKARKSVRKKLEKLLEKCAGSPVGRRVQEALAGLG